MRAALIALVLVACAEEPSDETFPVRFIAAADGAPVAGARVEADGVALGATGSDGVLDVALEGRAGRRVSLRAECPSAYLRPRDPPELTLHRLRSLSDAAHARRIRVAIACRPRERTAMLLVRAGGLEAVPVLVDGREVTRTDEHGLAHVELRYPAHTQIDVVLRTEVFDDVLPRNPARAFLLPDADEILVFDQAVQRDAPAAPSRDRARARPPRPPTIPQRID